MIYPHRVVILRGTAVTDVYGDPGISWDSPRRTPSPAWIQPRTTEEVNANRSAVVSAWMMFLPPGTDIGPHDRVEWADVIYTIDVDGRPAEMWNPSGPHHLEVPLRSATG